MSTGGARIVDRVSWMLCLISAIPPVMAGLEWELVANHSIATPPGRRDHALGFVVMGNRSYLILFGGRTHSNEPRHDTWWYDDIDGLWRNATKRTYPPARYSMVYGSSNGFFYIATGRGINDNYYNDIWKFDIRTEEWTELGRTVAKDGLYLKEPFFPKPRSGAAGGIHPGGSKFYVNQGSSLVSYFDTVVFDLNTEDWNIVDCKEGMCSPYTPYYPHARTLHTGTLVDPNTLIIFGGCLSGGGTGGDCPSGDTWLLNGQTQSWTEVLSCPVPRVYGSMAMLPERDGQRRAVLYGGIEVSSQVIQTTRSPADLVGVFDADSKQWSLHMTSAKQSFPSPRASVAMVTGPRGVFMFGGYDIDSGAVLGDLWLLRGDAVTAVLSVTVECPQSFTNLILVHGCLMVIGWGVFLVWGAYIARYVKSHGSPTWFYLHVILQVVGQLCSIAGFVMAILSVQSSHFGFAHGIIGLVVVILGILQPINAALRPEHSKKYCRKSFRRVLWESIHHFGGKSAILLALANISLGVFVANSRHVAWIFWFVYLGIVVVFLGVSQFVQNCLRNRKRPTEFIELVPTVDNTIHNYKPKMADRSV